MGGVQFGWAEEKGNGEMSVQSMGMMRKDFCPNFLQPFLGAVGAVTLKAGSLFQYVTTLTENSDPYPSAVARTLECLARGLSLAASSRREENLVRINIQKASEYREGGYPVSWKSSPLHGVKAQPLQSLFLAEVTKCLSVVPIFFNQKHFHSSSVGNF